MEYMLVYCSIFGGMIYLFICRIKSPEIAIHSDHLKEKGEGDFVDANMMIIDLFNAIVSPAIVGCLIAGDIGNHSDLDKNVTSVICSILFVQAALLTFGLWVKRLDFDWKPETNIKVPLYAKWCVEISMIAIPVIIIIISGILANPIDTAEPFLIVNCVC